MNDSLVGRIVLGHKDRQVRRQIIHGGGLVCRRSRDGLERQGHSKGRALAESAGDRDIAAHQLGQLAGDGQTQTGPAVPARDTRIQLFEIAEQALLGGGPQARAGVGDRQDESCPGRTGGQAQGDMATLGEFDRVRQQVQDDLTQPQRIGRNPVRNRRRDIDAQVQTLVPGNQGPHFAGVADHSTDVDGFGRQIHPSGLHLGQI